VLADLLHHAHGDIRYSALFEAFTVCQEERDAPAFFAPLFGELLSDEVPKIREETCWKLCWFGSASALAREALWKAAYDVSPPSSAISPPLRTSAISALARLGEVRVIAPLKALLEDPAAQQYCFFPLKYCHGFGSAAASLVPSLRRLLEGKNGAYLVGPMLGAIGAEAASAALPELIDALEDPNISGYAAEGLGLWGPAARSASCALIQALDEQPNSFERRRLAKALGLIGPDARSAIPALVKRLEDTDISVRAHAALAIWQIDPVEADLSVRSLIDNLNAYCDSEKPSDYWGCVAAAEFLTIIRPEARAASGALRTMLKHWYPMVRVRAAYSLWRMEKRARETVQLLSCELARSPAGLLALQCLEEIGPDAAAVVLPALRTLMDSDRMTCQWEDMGGVIIGDESFQAAAQRLIERIEG
jgi:HEAT repeat protein